MKKYDLLKQFDNIDERFILEARPDIKERKLKFRLNIKKLSVAAACLLLCVGIIIPVAYNFNGTSPAVIVDNSSETDESEKIGENSEATVSQVDESQPSESSTVNDMNVIGMINGVQGVDDDAYRAPVDGINYYLYEELKKYDDDQLLRINLKFIDDDLALTVEVDGYNFKEIEAKIDEMYYEYDLKRREINYGDEFNIYKQAFKENPNYDYQKLNTDRDEWRTGPIQISTEHLPGYKSYTEVKRSITMEARYWLYPDPYDEYIPIVSYEEYLSMRKELYERQKAALEKLEDEYHEKLLPFKKLRYEIYKQITDVRCDYLSSMGIEDIEPYGTLLTVTISKAELINLCKNDTRFYADSIGLYKRPEGYSDVISTSLANLLESADDDEVFDIVYCPLGYSYDLTGIDDRYNEEVRETLKEYYKDNNIKYIFKYTEDHTAQIGYVSPNKNPKYYYKYAASCYMYLARKNMTKSEIYKLVEQGVSYISDYIEPKVVDD